MHSGAALAQEPDAQVRSTVQTTWKLLDDVAVDDGRVLSASE